MTEQQMPARIWTYRISNFTEGYWRTRRATSNDTCYIRSDIAERMAEALAKLDLLLDFGDDDVDRFWEFEDTSSIQGAFEDAKSALSAFRSATQDAEARHD